jgi:hypothetical protein
MTASAAARGAHRRTVARAEPACAQRP